MTVSVRALGLATLLLIAGLAGTARAADSCDAADALIRAAQTKPLKDGLDSAQQAMKLCDGYASELFLAHVLGARGQWQEAENAYREARALAGADAEQVSQVDMERALLLAAEPGRTCEAVAAFERAAVERADQDLGPPPDWFTQKRRQVEGGWSKEGLSATEIRCELQARKSIGRSMPDLGGNSRRQMRTFCGEMAVSVPVHFDTDSAHLNPEGQRQIGALADAVRPLLHGDHVRLDGHADERGTDVHNQLLSEQRAGTVAAVLGTLLNLPPQQLRSFGHGSKQPKYSGHTAEDYRLNRRVELTLVPASCPL
jgi:outer membrane protein OmpA-like peptidoglycan-associated protein